MNGMDSPSHTRGLKGKHRKAGRGPLPHLFTARTSLRRAQRPPRQLGFRRGLPRNSSTSSNPGTETECSPVF